MESTSFCVLFLTLCISICHIARGSDDIGQQEDERLVDMDLDQFDDTLKIATHDQKMKILERLLKAIHEKSQQVKVRGIRDSKEDLKSDIDDDYLDAMNAYVDSGEPEIQNDLNVSEPNDDSGNEHATEEEPIKEEEPITEEEPLTDDEPVTEDEPVTKDDPLTEDCEENDEPILPLPPAFQRNTGGFGEIDDFPSDAIEQANQEISIGVSDDTRSSSLQLGRRRSLKCIPKQNKEKPDNAKKALSRSLDGFRSLQKQRKTYLIIKTPLYDA